MTRREQDALAHAIRNAWQSDGRISDEAARGSAQRAVSRLTQSIADTLGGYGTPSAKFDRARFVREAGFGHLDQF